MGAIFAAIYGVAIYPLFAVTFLYAIGFVTNTFVPKSIDSGTPAPLAEALVVNIILLALFAVQHSVMARASFKQWWTKVVPSAVERSTYVLFSSICLLLLYWQWRPMPAIVWSTESPTAIAALAAVFWSGWGMLFLSTFLINHFELFGLRQVFARLRNSSLPEPTFKTPGIYRYVRHPIYLGFLLGFWATPTMTVGHLLFAVGTTGYILIGISYEERDLVRQFGDKYRRYRNEVGMLFPFRSGTQIEQDEIGSNEVPKDQAPRSA